MSFDNIPLELRERDQWVTFSITPEGKKIPYIAGNCGKASSTNPTTWRSFELATKDVVDGKRPYIGYAFDSSDPFVFVDIDEAHPEILKAIPGYAQKSVSGEGTHIITRGSFEGEGTHPSAPAIGIFQTGRLCLMTGDVVPGRESIEDCDPDKLQEIYEWVKGANHKVAEALVETTPTKDDQEVIDRICQIETFANLWNGQAGPDHSESDHALICVLADHTPSNEQVRRIFRASALCRPHRATNKYIDRSLQKVRGKQEYQKEMMAQYYPEPKEEGFQELGDRSMIDTMPDSLVKEMASWVWHQSKYPLQEAAIAAAFAVMSTITGRSYQISGLGLNVWFILIARTGTGKNEYQNGISKIIKAVSDKNTYGPGFHHLFNGELGSGPALEDILSTTSRCFCYFPEFNDTFHRLSSSDAAPHISSLKKALLNIFMQSSKDGFISRRLLAHQKGEDTAQKPPIMAPNLVIGGETTPEGLYDKLTGGELASGFLQRFSILHSKPNSISRRTSPNKGIPFPDELADTLSDLFVKCDNMVSNNEFEDIPMTPEAQQYLIDYDHERRDWSLDHTNHTQAVREIYTRAGVKAFRIAALFSVGESVTLERAQWATAFVDEQDEDLISRFATGQIGTGQVKQESEIMALIKTIVGATKEKRRKQGVPERVANDRGVVTHTWLKKKAVGSVAFTTDKAGAITAFERCIYNMVKAGEIIKLSAGVVEDRFGKNAGDVYTIVGGE